MPVSAGTRLGPYEILSPLGAGGMGEVYKARDTRLDRAVAIKVLPERSALTPEARQRFEREARTISQLQHPHICALHDVGREGDTEYLVMELLEGETLAERLARGALPLEQALRYGADIADALDKAHRQGIVHRDLKPGNVMVTKSGVKLLDFGLAKTFERSLDATGREQAAAENDPKARSSFTALPTVAGSPNLTRDGAILGTVQYMAPEQLEGKNSDARTDIFALGCLLYEMCTGHKAFSGSSQASLISSIMKEDPAPVSARIPMSPPTLDTVVKTCLAKDPEDRWQTARDVAIQLEAIRNDRSSPQPISAGRKRGRGLSILPWIVTAAALALAAYASISARRPAAPAPVTQTFLPPPLKTIYHVIGANIGGVALSRDGRRLAFGASEPDALPFLWVRDMDALAPYRVPGTEGGLYPFWSPDGRWLAFFAKGKLKIVEAIPSPAPPRDLADVDEARGGTWGEDGTIVYAPQNYGGLMRVRAAGGSPSVATRIDKAQRSHRWPQFLPGGRRFLYQVRTPDPKAPLEVANSVWVGFLDSPDERELLPKIYEATNAMYAAPGFLLYRRGSALMAIRFRPESLTVVGEPAPVAQDVQGFIATGSAVFGVSEKVLVYCPRVEGSLSRMAWLDRSGKEVAAVGPAGRNVHAALSRDGREVIVATIQEPLPPDLWLYDTAAGRGVRLTRDTIAQVAPIFSADGQRIFYSSNSKGPWDLSTMRAHGSSEQNPLLESNVAKTANDVSPDGRYLLYRELGATTRGDLKYVSLAGEGPPQAFIATVDDETNGTFSPDGRWVAYSSDESGRFEVYVASFPKPAQRFRVSAEGGSQPRWSRDGKELFYVRFGELMATAVGRRGDELTFSDARPLFRIPLFTTIDPGFDVITRYDVAADSRFLALLHVGEEIPTPLVVVQNWAEALKAR